MCIEREREALLQFKDALVDDYGMLSSWTTSDCCQWQGIRCSNLTAHVLMLDLHGDFNDVQQRYMRGEIHKSLMELQQLNYLNLSSNSFQGRGIPEFLGSLTNLRYLDLSFSHFGGKIPTQFVSLLLFAKKNSTRTNRLNSFCVSLLPFPKERRNNHLNSFVSPISLVKEFKMRQSENSFDSSHSLIQKCSKD